MVGTPDGQESHKRNLHACNRSKRIPCRVADVQSRAVSPHADQDESVQWQHVCDEDISTPRCNHVSVEQCTERTPHDRTFFHALDPKIEGKDQQKDGNGFVVVTSSHGSGDVSGCNAHEGCGKQTSRRRVDHLRSEQVCRKCRQAGACWSKQNANVPDVDWECKEAKEVVDDTTGDHQSRVEGSTSDTSKWMPGFCFSSAVFLLIPVVIRRKRSTYCRRTNPRSCRSHSGRGISSL